MATPVVRDENGDQPMLKMYPQFILPELNNSTKYAEAVKSHSVSPTFSTINTMTILKNGKEVKTRIRAWTINGGGMAFMDVQD